MRDGTCIRATVGHRDNRRALEASLHVCYMNDEANARPAVRSYVLSRQLSADDAQRALELHDGRDRSWSCR